ncbi:MAG: hypothetical protein Q7S57_03205 [bacterium]|nr:hypothetical protein [bacterium]
MVIDRRKILFIASAIFFVLTASVSRAQEVNNNGDAVIDNSAAILSKEAELKAVQEKIDALNTAKKVHELEKNNLVRSIDIINDNIQSTRLELDKTAISIDFARLQIKDNQQGMKNAEKQVNGLRVELQGILREMSALDQLSLWQSLFSKGSFTDFLQANGAFSSLQRKMMNNIVVAQDARKVLGKQKNDLIQKQEDLSQLQGLQEAQKNSLNAEEGNKQTALTKTVAEQKKVSGLIAEAEQARTEINQKLFSLRSAGISMSLTDALKMAKYAGKVTGVRPALLLGVLKIESNLGTNVGSGRYPDDIHPLHREAFLRVVKKLGLDFATAPVSAKPKSYPGWGGAIGPGQIMPGIWESIENTVAELTGRALPSPYNLQDAFVATAIILRNSGAVSGSEFEAVNRYFAGGNWQRFTWYGDRVLAVAKEYESNEI